VGDLYDRVSSATAELSKLSSAAHDLQAAWNKEKLDLFVLVDHMYTTAAYVDNAFYKKLREVRAEPDQISVLHLRSYDEELPTIFERIWREINQTLRLYSSHPVYSFAKSIVEDVLPEFNVAYEKNRDRAYRETRRVVEQFVGEMQNSRILLKTPTG